MGATQCSLNVVRGLMKTAGGRLPRSTSAAFADKMRSLVPAELKAALALLLRSITSSVSKFINLMSKQSD